MRGTAERSQVAAAVAAAAIVLTGLQAILPALPSAQAQLGLTDTQVGWLVSVYFLPSFIFAPPLGLLVDRVGRRPVLTGGLALFGLAGIAIALGPMNLSLILALRFVQGVCFAAVMPLTITLLGDVVQGERLVAAQGVRSVAMFSFEAVLPVIGGALVAISWSTPFALQGLSLLLAPVCWRFVGEATRTSERNEGAFGDLMRLVKEPAVVALQAVTLSRFFLKFAFLTYLPILLVSKRGMSERFAGVALGIFAGSGVIAALAAGKVSKRARASVWLSVCATAFGAALVGVAIFESQAAIILMAVLFGLADGLYSTLINSLTSGLAESRIRASFVAFNGAVRNAGKFLAPTLLGIVVVWIPLESAYLVAGVAAIGVVLIIRPLRRFDPVLSPGLVAKSSV